MVRLKQTSTADPVVFSAADTPLFTSTLQINAQDIGRITTHAEPWIEDWSLDLSDSASALLLQEAVRDLRETDIPVAFPTETVYGLGADATREEAVKAIYRVKGRPSDNPLIVHFASIRQIKEFVGEVDGRDPIPSIYKPLIRKFWPGPLTILLPLPSHGSLAPSVTVGLKTFGARIPRNPIALSLIRLANVPVAAPSANASTKPSPTAAQHVAHDLYGRITTILDGGPCDVGVESTVVDGLSSPPAILRPGGVSIEQLRECEGWENVTIAYTHKAEGSNAPRAPGMKYRHYSPKAQVVLYENGKVPTWEDIGKVEGTLGVVLTTHWSHNALFNDTRSNVGDERHEQRINSTLAAVQNDRSGTRAAKNNAFADLIPETAVIPSARYKNISNGIFGQARQIWIVDLGSGSRSVARGLFSALRELDLRNVSTIFVEGLDEQKGDLAVAVMNRLRKAAEIKVP